MTERKKIYCQEWEESERGWGVRPDGASLHLTVADAAQYVKDYWDKQPPGPAPDEYSRPGGSPFAVFVSGPVYKMVETAQPPEHGVMIWRGNYIELCSRGEITRAI